MEKQYPPPKKWRLGGAEERVPIGSDTGIKSALKDDKHAAREQIRREEREADRIGVKVEGALVDMDKQELVMRGE